MDPMDATLTRLPACSVLTNPTPVDQKSTDHMRNLRLSNLIQLESAGCLRTSRLAKDWLAPVLNVTITT